MNLPLSLTVSLISATIALPTTSSIAAPSAKRHPTHPTFERSHPNKQKNLEFIPSSESFEGEGTPRGNTSSGGSRGDCLQQLIAVSPKPEEGSVQAGVCILPSQVIPTLTVSEHPTFWFYVPDLPSSVPAEFVLFDQRRQVLARAQVSLSGEAGVIGIRLDQSLEIDRSYQWQFRLDLNPRHPSENPRVEGLVRRIPLNPTLRAQLATASAQEQIALYANHGIWQETLTTLIELRQIEPSNTALLMDWSSLLASVKLRAITDAPLLSCCISQPVSH